MQTPQNSIPFARIAAGSYEGSLFGWNVLENASKSGLDCSMVYGFHCTPGPIKCIAASQTGKYLACGCSGDDKIRIFNANENKSLGELSQHTGSITTLSFVGDKFLLSSGEDNNVCIWRCSDWKCLHVLEGHDAPITAVAVHPSGKLAFTGSKDKTLRIWNLVHGRCSFTRKLKEDPFKICFDSLGVHYFVVNERHCLLFRVDDNSQVATISSSTPSASPSSKPPSAAAAAAAITVAEVSSQPVKQSYLSYVTSGSRINAAAFCCTTRGSSSTSDSTSELESESSSVTSARASNCIAIAYDDKSLKFYDLTGSLLSTWDMSFLDGGRIRDISVVDSPTVDNIADDTLREILDSDEFGNGGGDCLALCTSVGSVALLSISAAISTFEKADNSSSNSSSSSSTSAVVGKSNNKNSNSSSNSSSSKVDGSALILAMNTIRVEPRLTCVTAWCPIRGKNNVGDDINSSSSSSSSSSDNSKSKRSSNSSILTSNGNEGKGVLTKTEIYKMAIAKHRNSDSSSSKSNNSNNGNNSKNSNSSNVNGNTMKKVVSIDSSLGKRKSEEVHVKPQTDKLAASSSASSSSSSSKAENKYDNKKPKVDLKSKLTSGNGSQQKPPQQPVVAGSSAPPLPVGIVKMVNKKDKDKKKHSKNVNFAN